MECVAYSVYRKRYQTYNRRILGCAFIEEMSAAAIFSESKLQSQDRGAIRRLMLFSLYSFLVSRVDRPNTCCLRGALNIYNSKH